MAERKAQEKAFWGWGLGAVYDLSASQVEGGQPSRIGDRDILVSANPFSSGNLSAVLSENEVTNQRNRGSWVDEATVNINRRGRYLQIQLAQFDTL